MANRKRIGMIGIGVVFCLLLGTSAFAAAVTVGDTVTISSDPNHLGGFNGGAFVITDGSYQFASFCLEYHEYIDFSSNFTVSDISGAAYAGGGGSVPSPHSGINYDPISIQTQYLYYHFVQEDLAGFNFTGTASQIGNSQKDLQLAIWYLENEVAVGSITAGAQSFVNLANSYVTGGGSAINSVQVMNIVAGGTTPGHYYDPSVQKQSQLIYVPEPGSLLLLGSGLACLIGYRRYRRPV